MKKIFNNVIALLLICCSCQTDEIETYDAANYLQFTIAEQDTVEISFLMMGSVATYDYPVVVRHIGMPSETESRPFKMIVDDTATHIKTGMYTLPEFSFQPWSQLDTFYVRLINYPELENEEAILCLELQSNEWFTVGDRDYRRLYINVHNQVAKPSWWDNNTIRYFLGAYSDAKFRALIRALIERLGEADFTNTSVNNKRLWALEFKAWLKENPDETEENGLPFTIPVVE